MHSKNARLYLYLDFQNLNNCGGLLINFIPLKLFPTKLP